MSGNSGDLLRMLEPAVRPIGSGPGRAVSAGPAPPIEQRDFDALLREVKHANGPDLPEESAAATAADSRPPLKELSRVDAVANASLRRLLSGGEGMDR